MYINMHLPKGIPFKKMQLRIFLCFQQLGALSFYFEQ